MDRTQMPTLPTLVGVIILYLSTLQIVHRAGIAIFIPLKIVVDLLLGDVCPRELAHVHDVGILLLFCALIVAFAVDFECNDMFVFSVIVARRDGC